MLAREAHLPAIARLLADTLGGDDEHLGWLTARHTEDAARLRVALEPQGEAVAFVRLFTPAPDQHWLTAPRLRPGADAAAVALLDEALAVAAERGWRRLSTRVDQTEVPAAYRDALTARGFVAHNSRIEFKTPLAELPPEVDNPLRWEPLDTFGHAAAAALIDRAGRGPEWEADDTGAAVLAHALGRDDLYHAPDCVQIGRVHGEPAAFVIAQSAPSGWSTITFMGLAPAFRGRGLGRHVHRHGLAMLRAQGGTLYHGGTSATNRPMVRLFEEHGCRVFARLVEYVRTA